MIRFGIVGAGGIATKFARDIHHVKNAQIVAVSARTEDKAKQHQIQYQVPYAFSSYEAMAKSDVIDAVYIATPHRFHAEQAILFLQHKKHVLVEKPIAVNQKEFAMMKKVAKENGVLLMEAMWTHFLPSTRFLVDYLKQNDIGRLLEANIDFGYALIDDYPEEKRLLNPALAGGSLLDIGVYPIAFYHLLAQAKTKTLKAQAEMTKTGVDATCIMGITDALDAKITIRSSIAKNLPNNADLIYEKATIRVIDFSRSKELYINDQRFDIDYVAEGFPHQIASFCDSIEKGELQNPVMTHDASMKTIKTMDQVRKIIGLQYPFE